MRHALLAVAVLLALPQPALAAKITVDKATISKGQLVISGRSKPGTTVSIAGTGYKRTVSSKGTFSFAFKSCARTAARSP
jgi:hypothetical protein